VPLVQRDGSPLGIGRASALAASWGAGAAAGVALGAVLSAVSGAGAPGIRGLDLSAELGWWPLIVGAGVFVAHLAVTVVVAAVRGEGSRGPDAQTDDRQKDSSQDRVERQVGAEVPPAQT
jgi:hypothetical protein